MHFITSVQYEAAYKLRLRFEDHSERLVDLAAHLDGEIFAPLKDLQRFHTAHLNTDLDTVVWENGADMSPDFLFEISVPVAGEVPASRVAEAKAPYG
jgi:hypothetical protein